MPCQPPRHRPRGPDGPADAAAATNEEGLAPRQIHPGRFLAACFAETRGNCAKLTDLEEDSLEIGEFSCPPHAR